MALDRDRQSLEFVRLSVILKEILQVPGLLGHASYEYTHFNLQHFVSFCEWISVIKQQCTFPLLFLYKFVYFNSMWLLAFPYPLTSACIPCL